MAVKSFTGRWFWIFPIVFLVLGSGFRVLTPYARYCKAGAGIKDLNAEPQRRRKVRRDYIINNFFSYSDKRNLNQVQVNLNLIKNHDLYSTLHVTRVTEILPSQDPNDAQEDPFPEARSRSGTG